MLCCWNQDNVNIKTKTLNMDTFGIGNSPTTYSHEPMTNSTNIWIDFKFKETIINMTHINYLVLNLEK